MRRVRLVFAVTFAFATVGAPLAAEIGATPPRPDNVGSIVRTGPHQGGFGAFTGANAEEARRVFGAPTGRSRSGHDCELRWAKLGISAQFITYRDDVDVCRHGDFSGATLTTSRWRTLSGLRVGSSEAAVGRAAIRRCGHRDSCAMTQWLLGQFPSDCAGRLVPSVVATIKARRLHAFHVYTHTCE